MSPAQFFDPLLGQSLLLGGQLEDYRGQCVQSVCLWLQNQGVVPPTHLYAYMYYDAGIDGFTKIPAGQPILAGDIIVWGKNFPPSPGAGHIDVAAQDGAISDFWAYDSNWIPLKLAKVHHTGINNQYIAGYLRNNKGVDMITTANNLKYLYLGVYAQDVPDATLATDAFIGKDFGEVTSEVLDYANKNGFAYWQVKPTLEKQIADLKAKLAAVPVPVATPVVETPVIAPTEVVAPETVVTAITPPVETATITVSPPQPKANWLKIVLEWLYKIIIGA